MLLHHLLEASADRYPEKPALWHKQEWTTYGQLERSANRLAHHFRAAGIGRGERIALLLENSPDYVVAHMAVYKAGAANVSLNTETTSEILQYLLHDCEARILVIGRKFLRHLLPVKDALPQLRHIIVEGEKGDDDPPGLASAYLADACRQGSDHRPRCPAIDIDLASIVYTSGSTGKPKGVMLSHLNLVNNTKSIAQYLKLHAGDRILVVLPFHYIYGSSLLYTHFLVGGSVVLDSRFAYPNVVLETLKATEATGFAGVPSTFMILLDKSSLRKMSFEHLRYVTQAGGSLAPHIQKQVHEVFSPAKLYVMYGSTEAAPRLTYLEPDDLPRKWGSIGKGVPNVDVFPADGQGRRVPPGSEGELAARGSNIMMGYWKDPAGTAEVLRHGLYYTGDLGKEDEEGFLFVVGRTKDIIKVGGNRVSAKEIEEKLLEFAGVAEAAVIGVEDPILGEAAKAFLVARDGFAPDEKEIKVFLQSRLPPYKQPKLFEFRSELPKNEAGKILKAKLKGVG